MTCTTRANQVAADVLATALEGGVGYWSLATDIKYDETTEDVVYLGVTLHEAEDDDEKIDAGDCILHQTIYGNNYYRAEGHTITLEDVKDAINRIAFETVKYASDRYMKALCRSLIFNPEEADYDSDDADRIVQVAALGEVIYG
jgi:hypothetical protein